MRGSALPPRRYISLMQVLAYARYNNLAGTSHAALYITRPVGAQQINKNCHPNEDIILFSNRSVTYSIYIAIQEQEPNSPDSMGLEDVRITRRGEIRKRNRVI